jgi:hypothetical protein
VADVQGRDGEVGEVVMTAAGFGRLLYTDCAPGTGRSGGGGFQVQAQSPEVDSRGSALATSWLLYEVQSAWLAEQRPVGAFPPGFAHVAAGGYGTGQSRYVGKEVMGGRQGNHLADCLVTGDPELYGTIRPAQLYGAPFWRAEPWPTTDCPDLASDLEPGPQLTLDELTTWARDRPERGPVLARLLSVLEDPDGPRVVIVSADADEAMRWLAAATLLLPQRRALDVAFKVFSANPLRAQQRVVAAPADLNPQLRPGLVPGVFILDAAACQADDAPASERAAFLARKLAGDPEADPYDLLDALELAGELSGGSWPTWPAALSAAWALIRPDEPLEAPEQVQGWLRKAEAEQLTEHGPALIEMMLAADLPPADMMRWLDDAVATGRLGFDQETVRTRLLAAELADAVAGKPPPRQSLPPVPLSDKAERDAESELTSALLLGDPDRMDPGRFDRLLQLAFRHRIALPPSPLRERLHGFAVAWIDEPRARWEPRGRALADCVLDEAYDVLHERFTEPLSQQLAQVLARFGGVFDDRDDLADPLYCHLQAAAIASLKQREDRLARLRVSLGKISRLASSPEAAEAARVFQEALLAWKADDTDVALTILGQLPSHIDPRIGERANSFLAAAQAKPNTELLDMLASLHASGWHPPSDKLTELLDGEIRVRGFLAAASRADIVARDRLIRAVELISDADPVVVELRASAVLDAFLSTRNPHLAGVFFARYPTTKMGRGKRNPIQTLITLTGERMAAASTTGESASITARVVTALASQTLQRNQPRRWTRLAELVQNFDSRLSGKDSRKWRAEVQARLAPDSRELREWDELFATEPIRPGGMFNLIRKTES